MITTSHSDPVSLHSCTEYCLTEGSHNPGREITTCGSNTYRPKEWRLLSVGGSLISKTLAVCVLWLVLQKYCSQAPWPLAVEILDRLVLYKVRISVSYAIGAQQPGRNSLYIFCIDRTLTRRRHGVLCGMGKSSSMLPVGCVCATFLEEDGAGFPRLTCLFFE